MATKFTFPKSPRVGDRVEFVSISEDKLPINIVGNPEANKDLKLIFPDQTYQQISDGETVVHSVTQLNCVLTFKYVSVEFIHTWVLEGCYGYAALDARLTAVEEALGELANL